jgi:hypothetical protein
MDSDSQDQVPIYIRPDSLRLSVPAVRQAVNAYIDADIKRINDAVYTRMEREIPKLVDILKGRKVSKDHVSSMQGHYNRMNMHLKSADVEVVKLATNFLDYADAWYPFHADLGERLVDASDTANLGIKYVASNIALTDFLISEVHPTIDDAIEYHFKHDAFSIALNDYYAVQTGNQNLFLEDEELMSFRQSVFAYRMQEWQRRY